eukprot:gnl/TRDRNA2_/TRDRNA2_162658_c0_seq1.p1 gnl/TRDRNA2_/TRDRNA2_162658_c0~~gnl/TRDRNA2_/TRDRNA2_162658_c0_seq1.p1  ORF type:complete len:122 (-),score=12.77 gnl/TRDRNA2_/TRDRNA2_162658_c0_seq1:233-598(-)
MLYYGLMLYYVFMRMQRGPLTFRLMLYYVFMRMQRGPLTFRLMLYYVFMQVQWGVQAQSGALRMFYYIFMWVQWGLAFGLRALLCLRAPRLLQYLVEPVWLGIRYRNPWELGSSLGLLHSS